MRRNPPQRPLTRARAEAALRAMQGRRVAVIGDAMLDEFLWGDAHRISPEAPVPVVLLERASWALGGAANVAANIAALGGRPVLFAALGADADGERLRQLVAAAGVETGALLQLADRPTTVKHRIFARNKHLIRFDQEITAPLLPPSVRELLQALRAAPRLDGVVVSDYAKGCVTPLLARGVARVCTARRLPWCVDPKLTSIAYRGATVVKPNLTELQALSRLPVHEPEQLRRAAAATLRRQGCHHLLVTRGAHGMVLFGPGGAEQWLDGGGQQVADVTGAGDTVSAVLALGLAARLELAEAAALANLAAAHVVTVPGTAVARPEDVIARLG